jgi:hypothetical protein
MKITKKIKNNYYITFDNKDLVVIVNTNNYEEVIREMNYFMSRGFTFENMLELRRFMREILEEQKLN